MSRLRRVARLCSRTVSDTANTRIHERTQCVSAEEKILCRSPISQRSHVGNLRQTLQGKGVIHKRVETVGVYPLVCPRGVSALPAEVQRKPLRPDRANPPAAVRVPQSAGAEKRLPPGRGEHAHAVRAPRSAGAEKKAAARKGRTRLPSGYPIKTGAVFSRFRYSSTFSSSFCT